MSAPCPCECNRGEFCGGCGHTGCGRRRGPKGQWLGMTLAEKHELVRKLKLAVRVENWTDVALYATMLDQATIMVQVQVQR